jgi:hypothetical protein
VPEYVNSHSIQSAGDQPHIMAPLAQSTAQKVRPSARFHADHLHLQVRGEVQQMRAGKTLPYPTSRRWFITAGRYAVFPKSIAT